MANTILRAEQIVQAALLLLNRELVLPMTVWRQASTDFVGAKDDTITLRIPATIAARTRTVRATTALTEDEFAEVAVPVALSTHVYSLIKATDADLTLSITDFAQQVIQPQITAVSEGYENVIAGALAGATVNAANQLAVTYATDDPKTMFNAANKRLNQLNVPRSGRYMVVGANVEEWILNNDVFRQANTSGSDSAMRDAIIGRMSGFEVLGSNAIGVNAAYAYHMTAVASASVAPVVPEGATTGATLEANNIAMRYLRDYNPLAANDRSMIDLFAGAASVEEGGENKRLVVVTGT